MRRSLLRSQVRVLWMQNLWISSRVWQGTPSCVLSADGGSVIFAIPVAVRRVRLTRPNRAKLFDSTTIGSRRIRILGNLTSIEWRCTRRWNRSEATDVTRLAYICDYIYRNTSTGQPISAAADNFVPVRLAIPLLGSTVMHALSRFGRSQADRSCTTRFYWGPMGPG